MNSPTRNLTPEQAAERIGLSYGRLAKLRMTGEGPAFLKIGRKIMYRPDDIERWLDSKRLTQSPPKGWKGGRKPAGSDHHSAAA
jgi:hypothetical protein